MNDLLDITLIVAAALEQGGIPYTVGGSLASSLSGEPRASIDADIVVDLRLDQVEGLIGRLGNDFYADAEAISRAITRGSSANLVHRTSGIKVDLFPASSLLDRQQLRRRQHVQVSVDPDRWLYVHSAEDILLQKLHWYRLGGETSERQWRDVLSILLVQDARLDRAYVDELAQLTGLTGLLRRAIEEARPGDRS